MKTFREFKELAEAKRGLYANIHAKRKRGERPARPGSEDYPAKDAFKKAARTAKKEDVQFSEAAEQRYCPKCKKMETKSECAYGPEYWENNATKTEPTNEAAAWTRKAGKNKSGGLNEKGRKSYERENPGSDLKAPSKKVGNPRRASFCARMKGMKKKLTSKKTARDPDSRINKSLRAWNC